MTAPRASLVALVGDGLASVLFVALGLRAHGHLWGDLLRVWYPFGVGLVVAALVDRRRRDVDGVGAGIRRAVVVVAVAMVIRVVNGQGTTPVFCLVALGFVALFFSLWRLGARRARHQRG
jgi:Protein of unknown function (DUF3054)